MANLNIVSILFRRAQAYKITQGEKCWIYFKLLGVGNYSCRTVESLDHWPVASGVRDSGVISDVCAADMSTFADFTKSSSVVLVRLNIIDIRNIIG